MVNKDRLIDTFLRLGAINSPSGNEGAIADVLEGDLRALGFDVVRDRAGEKIGGNTGNLIGSKKGNVPDALPILLCAHMDTVTPTVGWGYEMDGDYIRSEGNMILGADDKAGIAVILEALKIIEEQGIPHGDIQVLFSIAEETGLWGAKHLDHSLVTSQCAFVYDMGRPVGSITVSAPSHDNILATFKGKASHAGASPEKGINAIVAAGKAIAAMNVGRIDKETTANVGIISGGQMGTVTLSSGNTVSVAGQAQPTANLAGTISAGGGIGGISLSSAASGSILPSAVIYSGSYIGTVLVRGNVGTGGNLLTNIVAPGYLNDVNIYGTAGLPTAGTVVGPYTVTDTLGITAGTSMGVFRLYNTATSANLAGNLNGVVTDNRSKVDNIASNLESTTANFKDFSDDIKQHPWKLLMKGK